MPDNKLETNSQTWRLGLKIRIFYFQKMGLTLSWVRDKYTIPLLILHNFLRDSRNVYDEGFK
ncbi:MAG: hypothetical protein C0407_15865 [Desulfobacca sp.]|nr:hypothetical protein [Desulfobacca sp.]